MSRNKIRKKKQEEAAKNQPKKGPKPKPGKEGVLHFYIQRANSMHTVCIQCATLMLVIFFQLTHTSANYHLQITSIVQH